MKIIIILLKIDEVTVTGNDLQQFLLKNCLDSRKVQELRLRDVSN